MASAGRLVALLRGVNVNGITVTSAALAATFAGLGLTGVRTVLASGNVVFDQAEEPTAASLAQLKADIEAGLARDFGYDAWIVLVPQERVARLAAAYPFPRTDDTHHPYLVFSSSADVAAELAAGAAELNGATESVAPGDGVLYWRVQRGASVDSPFAKLLAKSRYKPHVTTRNLRTVEKLATA